MNSTEEDLNILKLNEKLVIVTEMGRYHELPSSPNPSLYSLLEPFFRNAIDPATLHPKTLIINDDILLMFQYTGQIEPRGTASFFLELINNRMCIFMIPPDKINLNMTLNEAILLESKNFPVPYRKTYWKSFTSDMDWASELSDCVTKINEKVYSLTHPYQTTVMQEGGRNQKKKRKTRRQKKRCYRRSRRIRKRRFDNNFL